MPTKRPYPPEHYPASYFDAVRNAVNEPDTSFTAAVATSSNEGTRHHTKLKAMLKHIDTFAGQDPKLVEAVRAKRLHIKKVWDGKAKTVSVNVCLYSRPSEQASQALADFAAGLRSTPF